MIKSQAHARRGASILAVTPSVRGEAQPACSPLVDLACIADALVSLTAFLMRMSADKTETVTGPIDVALLSKGDGFVWVKHKTLIKSENRVAA